jgi:hypothetical protein
MRATRKKFRADPYDTPTQGFEFSESVDVSRALSTGRPMVLAVVLDRDLPLAPTHVEANVCVPVGIDDLDLRFRCR